MVLNVSSIVAMLHVTKFALIRSATSSSLDLINKTVDTIYYPFHLEPIK